MYIYRQLVTDENCQQKKNKIVRRLRMNIGQVNIYLICLAHNRDYFDIINAANLKQKGYPKKDLFIIGIAEGNDSAIQLSTQLYIEFMKAFGKTDFKAQLIANKEHLFRRC